METGDGIADMEVKKPVAHPVCRADADEKIKHNREYISLKKGGHGCGRDVSEQVLKTQGLWIEDEAFG